MNVSWDALAAAWTVLARLVHEPPTEQELATLRAETGRGVWPLADGPRSGEGLALLGSSTEEVQAVADDHFRLFRGPGERLAVPWGSVYLSEEGLLFDEQTMAVRAAYARHGLEVPHLNRDPDDHIALELTFLATLLARALDAEEAGDTATANGLLAEHDTFCRDHLLPFAPEFFARVEQHASTHFYRGVGVLGSDAMAQLTAQLADD